MGLLRVALMFLALSGLACKTSGGRTSFLVFGSPGAPQEELIERIRGAHSETLEAKQDFSGAFLLYQRLTTPQAAELEDLSEEFEDALESCEERSHDLAERLELVRKDSDELFQGWTEELTHFSGDTLRKKSEAMLQDTRARAQRVSAALERVKSRMEPVMQKLHDYALFFHHNLNARAIATLEDTYKDFDGEFRALDSEFDKVQGEVDAFLATFEPPAPTEK